MSALRGVGKKGRVPLLKRGQIARFVVRNAVDPAAPEDSDPLEGQSTDRGVMGRSLGAVLVIEGSRPERAHDGLRGPLDERLSDERRASPTPVHPDG